MLAAIRAIQRIPNPDERIEPVKYSLPASPEVRAEAIEMLKNGKSVKRVAVDVGYNETSIREWGLKAGILKPRIKGKDRRVLVMSLISSNPLKYTTKELSEIIGTSSNVIWSDIQIMDCFKCGELQGTKTKYELR